MGGQRPTLQGNRCEGTHHNFREFDVDRSDHIDPNRVDQNQYFDLTTYTGGELLPMPPGACEGDLIHATYEREYSEGLRLQNEAYRKQGHRERCKTLEQLEHGKQTRPMEFIFQLGDMHNHPTGEELKTAFEQYLTNLQQYCRKNGIKCHLISAALHLDEATPHIHVKMTFSAAMQRGGQLPRQEECFRQSKLELPNPAQKESRYNNRLMTFTEHCRAMEHEVFRGLGYEIETTPRPNMRHMETREYYTQAAINQQKEIRASVDRINAKISAERSEIAQKRSELDKAYETLDKKEKAVLVRENLVKRIQEGNVVDLAGKQYNILEILRGLEYYKDEEVSKFIDQFTGFFKEVAEQGRTDLQEDLQEQQEEPKDGWDFTDDDD